MGDVLYIYYTHNLTQIVDHLHADRLFAAHSRQFLVYGQPIMN